MTRKILVLSVVAVQLVVFGTLTLWTIQQWRDAGWTGLAYNASLSPDAERAARAAPFPSRSQQIIAVAPRSPAAGADLTGEERVLSVNGIAVDDVARLRELSQTLRAGDPVTYTLRDDRGEREITLPLESPFKSPFVITSMVITLAVGLIWLAISLLVFWSRPQARTANVFFLLASTGASLYFVWALGELRWPDLRGIVPTTMAAGPWIFIGVITVLSILFGNFLLHLALVFPKPRPVVERWPRIFVWLHTLPFLVFVGVGGMIGTAQLTRPILGLVAFEIVVAGLGIWLAIRLVRAVRSEGWKNGLLHRPLAVEGLVILAICQLGQIIRLLPDSSAIIVGIFVGLMIALSLVGLITLYSVLTCISLFRSYRESGVDVQRQVRWPLWGTLTAVAISVAVTVFSLGIGLLTTRLGISSYTLTTIANSITKAVYLLIPLSFAFAILKYRLLDIDVIIRKTVIYSGVTGIVLALYLGLAGLSGAVLVRTAGLHGETATIVTTLAVVALFVPIRNRVQRFVDRRFFQRERDLEAARRNISQLVLATTELDHILPTMADEIQRALNCRNVAIFALAPEGGVLRCEASVGLPEERLSSLKLGPTSPVFASDDRIVRSAADEPLRKAKSEVAAIARRSGDPIGVVSVGSRLDGDELDGDDEAFLEHAADQLSLAVGRARQDRAESELARARDIQRSLLPATVPQIEGIAIATRWQPAREVSGDYYDVLRLDDHRLALCIGDVVGKGMPAALLMSSLQASLKAVAHQTDSPKEVCTRVREVMLASLKGGTFVTFFYCLVDRDTNRLSYCNAGHNPPFLVRADGTVVRLDVGGPIIARIAAERPYQEAAVAIGPGDRILLFTDGVTEAMNVDGDMFEDDRLEALLLAHRSASPQDLEQIVTNAVLEHARGTLQDDLTLIVAAVENS
jgi:sigma-B regulation protein RsbU (phosphoserine phosphatase)